MNLRQKYTEETGKDANRLPYQSICSVTIDYVEWLEQKVRQNNVVGQSEQLSCGRNITTCVFHKDGGKCSNPEYCRDQTT